MDERIEKFNILYSGGEGRYAADAVNFLLSRPVIGGRIYASYDDSDCELYAEVPMGDEDEDYVTLKREILRQAAGKGIPAEMLEFPYDD